MKLKGSYYSSQKDFLTNKEFITFEVVGIRPEDLQNISRKDLLITAEEYKEKRGLDANAYFHVLVNKIAGHHEIMKPMHYIKNQMIASYGQCDLECGTLIPIMLKQEIDAYDIDSIHLQPTHIFLTDDGQVYREHILMRGSHTYNTKEMSTLIEGTIQEAKQLDIETIPPDRLARMYAEWERKNQ